MALASPGPKLGEESERSGDLVLVCEKVPAELCLCYLSLCQWSPPCVAQVLFKLLPVLGLRGSRLCRVKSQFSLASALLDISPSGFQARCYEGIIFPVQDPWGWGAQGKAQTPLSSRVGEGFSMNVNMPPTCGSLPWGWGFWRSILASYPSQRGPFICPEL